MSANSTAAPDVHRRAVTPSAILFAVRWPPVSGKTLDDQSDRRNRCSVSRDSYRICTLEDAPAASTRRWSCRVAAARRACRARSNRVATSSRAVSRCFRRHHRRYSGGAVPFHRGSSIYVGARIGCAFPRRGSTQSSWSVVAQGGPSLRGDFYRVCVASGRLHRLPSAPEPQPSAS